MHKPLSDLAIAESLLHAVGQDTVFQKQNQNPDAFIQPVAPPHQNLTKTGLYQMLSAFYEKILNMTQNDKMAIAENDHPVSADKTMWASPISPSNI